MRWRRHAKHKGRKKPGKFPKPKRGKGKVVPPRHTFEGKECRAEVRLLPPDPAAPQLFRWVCRYGHDVAFLNLGRKPEAETSSEDILLDPVWTGREGFERILLDK